jgi:hypothetical protein
LPLLDGEDVAHEEIDSELSEIIMEINDLRKRKAESRNLKADRQENFETG